MGAAEAAPLAGALHGKAEGASSEEPATYKRSVMPMGLTVDLVHRIHRQKKDRKPIEARKNAAESAVSSLKRRTERDPDRERQRQNDLNTYEHKLRDEKRALERIDNAIADDEKKLKALYKERDDLLKEQKRDHDNRSRAADDLKRACVNDDHRGIRSIASRILDITGTMDRRQGKLNRF